MDAFEIDQVVQYYQGVIQNDQQTVLWTDGFKTTHTKTELKRMLYNPIAVVYN